MLNIEKLLSESKTPEQALLANQARATAKWQKTGLLEGLEGTEKGGMAVLLENQARQLVTESSRTGGNGYNGANAEQWNGVALPLVRKVFAEISAKEFVSVQPMNMPSGLIFYMDFKYGTAQPPRLVGESVYGDTTSSAAPRGGLYGAGRFGYSLNDVTASGALAVSGTAAYALATSASTNFLDGVNPAGLATFAVPVSLLPNADLTAVRSFVPSGANFAGWAPAFTTLSADRTQVIFVGNAATSASINLVTYTVQPTDINRGTFEDKTGSSIPPRGVDIDIPEIDIDLRSEPIVATSRKLKATWTPELVQDLNAYHSIDAEAELTAMLSEMISLEIDLEILEMLLGAAQTTGYWSRKIANRWNGSAFVTDSALAGQAWTDMSWFQTLGVEMQRVSNRIHQLTLRGPANFAVVSPSVATILETIPGFSTKTNGSEANFAMGISKVGEFNNQFQIYKNPYFGGNVMLMGAKGKSFLETGAVYAPYIPIIMTPLVYDPQNFTPRRGVMTRYAKKVVRPEFFAKIIIDGVPN